MTVPVYNMTDTWNNGATVFSAILMNVTNTASAAGSLLLDLQIGGLSKFSGYKEGIFAVYNTYTDASNYERGVLDWGTTSNTLTIGTQAAGTGTARGISAVGGWIFASTIQITGSVQASANIRAGVNCAFYWDSSAGVLTSPSGKTVQFGDLDAASPVAQVLSAQSVSAGTSNTAGLDLSFSASRGTGTAVGGKFIIQTAPAGATGSSQNTLVPGITVTAPAQRAGVTQQPSIILGNAALATADTDGFLYIPTCAGTPSGTPTTATGRVAMIYDTTNNKFYIFNGSWKGGTAPGTFT